MLSFLKAAPVAALCFTLLSVASFSGAGFAFGAAGADSKLQSDTILVSTAVLAADAAALDTALSPSKAVVVFSPGTGDLKIELPKTEAASEITIPSGTNLAELVRNQGSAGELDGEMRCLAGAVYFESKGESLAGQLAVARVVLARTKSGRFPSSICGVVFQPSQFSFVRGGKMPRIDTGSQNWRNAVAISEIAMNDSWKSSVEGALFFHARYVSPGWKLKRVGIIDNHVFYR
jgi:spore germination cell wall hydrolase CwlJ-like protein